MGIKANITGTTAGLNRVALDISDAARLFIVESTAQVTRDAQANANTGSHARGLDHIPGTGPGPNVISGTLRRSIRPTLPIRTAEGWSGTAGPTVGYARAIELGHPAWADGAKYPYLGPAIVKWRAGAQALMAECMRVVRG